jgi:outer membrane scaffolding protein for murein synthesis (MipA/OmpV family)
MKKVLFLFLFTLIIFVNKKANAQLKGIYYQAVAITEKGNQIAGKDINGLAIHNKAISVRFSVLKGGPEGAILYQETHQTKTDPTGLFSLIIGQGEVTNAGQFNELYKVDWSTIDHFLKVEIDLNNEANFKLMSVQQFMAVPYAYYAEKAKQIEGSNDTSITNELQMLSISNDTIYLSNGGFVKLPPNASVSWNNITNLPGSIDSIINNQYQIDYSNVTNTPNIPTNTSQLNNDAGFISTEVDGSLTNELQTLSISNDTIYLSNGGFVKLPPNASVSWNNITNLPGSIDSIINNQYQIDYSNVTNTPNIPTNTSQLNNDAGFITNEVDGSITNELQTLSISNDTIYLSNGGFVKLPPNASVSWNNITNLPGSIDSIINNQYQIDYSNVTNTPNIPTNTSQLNNDAGFISTEVDGSLTNELQTLSISNDTIYLTNGGFVKLPPNASVSWNNITNLPGSIDSIINNQYQIDYSNVNNTPNISTNTSQLNNDAGFITNEVDGSITNELQTLSISNDTIYLTNGGFVKLPPNASVSWNNITNIPGSIDSIINNQYQIDYSNVTNTPNIPTNTSQLNNDAGFITNEVDGSITNELQTLSISNDTIYLTNGGGSIKIPTLNANDVLSLSKLENSGTTFVSNNQTKTVCTLNYSANINDILVINNENFISGDGIGYLGNMRITITDNLGNTLLNRNQNFGLPGNINFWEILKINASSTITVTITITNNSGRSISMYPSAYISINKL